MEDHEIYDKIRKLEHKKEKIQEKLNHLYAKLEQEPIYYTKDWNIQDLSKLIRDTYKNAVQYGDPDDIADLKAFVSYWKANFPFVDTPVAETRLKAILK